MGEFALFHQLHAGYSADHFRAGGYPLERRLVEGLDEDKEEN
jgi:hypothetical protein